MTLKKKRSGSLYLVVRLNNSSAPLLPSGCQAVGRRLIAEREKLARGVSVEDDPLVTHNATLHTRWTAGIRAGSWLSPYRRLCINTLSELTPTDRLSEMTASLSK